MDIEHLQHYAPWLILPVVVIVFTGILFALRGSELDGATKAAFKRDVVHELRKQVGGITALQLGNSIGLDVHKTLQILESMQEEGFLVSHVTTDRRTMWRLKGVGPGQAD